MEVYFLELVLGRAPQHAAPTVDPREAQPKREVLVPRKAGEQNIVLWHHPRHRLHGLEVTAHALAERKCATVGDRDLPDHAVHRRRLAGTVLPEEGQDSIWFHDQRQFLERRRLIIRLAHLVAPNVASVVPRRGHLLPECVAHRGSHHHHAIALGVIALGVLSAAAAAAAPVAGGARKPRPLARAAVRRENLAAVPG